MALAPEGYEPTTRERLGLFRRLRPPAESATLPLTAAGQFIDLGNESAMQHVLRSRQQWQSQVWDAFYACGEVSNAVLHLADLMSRVTLFAAEEPDQKDSEPVRTTNSTVEAAFARLGTTVDVSELLRDMTIQLLLPGEFNLVGIQPGPDRVNPVEEWRVYSIDEVKVQGDTAIITDYRDGLPLTLRKGSDTWIRIWRPDPRHRQKAFSPMRPLLGAVDELVWWDSAAASVAMSRAAMAGFIGIPTNLELPAESADDARLSGNQRFIKRVFTNIGRAIREPRSPSAAQPFLFSYPWNESGKSGLEVIPMERPQDALLEQRTDRSLRRIAQGFPLPVEEFFGMGEATRGGAGQITKAKFTEKIEPFAVFLVTAVTQHWLRPILRKTPDVNAEKFLSWYDASKLIAQPDEGEAADKGFEYGNINAPAWRRTRNFSESDAPSDAEKEEQLAWIRALRGREGSGEKNPSDEQANRRDSLDTDIPTEPKDGGSHPSAKQPTAMGKGKGQPVMSSISDNGIATQMNLGRRLAEIDADLLSRLQVMASEQTRQARIKAGNFLKSRANKNPSLKASIRNVAPEDVAITLGREAVLSLGTDGILDDTFSDVPTQFTSWCDRAVDACIEASALPTTIVSSGTFQLAYSTTDAATALVRELKENTMKLIFEQPSTTSPAPESDDMLVPASLIRRAMARVGNPSANGTTNLLLATGRTFTKHLAEAGHYANDHEWWYPPKPRSPSAHHKKLDGQRFRVDDSPIQPGDGGEHCVCIAIPCFES